MSDVRMLTQHWETAPPIHVSLAGFLGTGKTAAGDADDAPASPEAVREFVEQFKRR